MSASKGQSAIEYLTTYGWAVLIIVGIIGVIFWLDLIGPSDAFSTSCFFPGDINCVATAINTTGNFTLDIGQGTGHQIRVTAVKCTQDTNASPNETDMLSPPITIAYGQHAWVANGSSWCYNYFNGNSTKAEGLIGAAYKGKMYVQYEEVDTGMTHLLVGDVIIKYDMNPLIVVTPSPIP